MVSPTPTAADVIIDVQSWINGLGVRAAFKVVGKLLLYSGPRKSIAAAYKGFDRNHARAKAKAASRSRRYTLIDYTEAGKRLAKYHGGKSLYQYFEGIYGRATDSAGNLIFEKQASAVWAYASEILMQVAKGDVETLICGASFDSISYVVEMPALLKNPKIKSINGVDADKLRKTFFSGQPDAAYETFRKLCQGELALARKRAAAAKSKAVKATLQEEYEIGRAFFLMERRETISAKMSASVPAAVSGHLVTAPVAPIPPAFVIGSSHSHSKGLGCIKPI